MTIQSIKKFILCGHKYSINHPLIEDCLTSENGGTYIGLHSPLPTPNITIARDMSEDQQEETLWHEIIEAIQSTHDIKMPHQTISTIGHELWRMHKDNKWGQFNG